MASSYLTDKKDRGHNGNHNRPQNCNSAHTWISQTDPNLTCFWGIKNAKCYKDRWERRKHPFQRGLKYEIMIYLKCPYIPLKVKCNAVTRKKNCRQIQNLHARFSIKSEKTTERLSKIRQSFRRNRFQKLQMYSISTTGPKLGLVSLYALWNFFSNSRRCICTSFYHRRSKLSLLLLYEHRFPR